MEAVGARCRTAAFANRITLVSAGLSLLLRRRPVAAVLVAVVLLPGCDDFYPDDYTYPVREDPVVIKTPIPPDFPESGEPDRPGLLPLLSIKNLDEVHNPLHKFREEVRKTILR